MAARVDPLEAGEWIDWGEHYLTENPVVSVKDFEDAILAQFKGDMTATHEEPQKGRTRKRKENLTDHVKKSLTQRNLIRYFDTKDDKYIVFLRPIGTIRDIGTIVDTDQVWLVIAAFASV